MRLTEAAVTKAEGNGAAKIRVHPDRVRRWPATFACADPGVDRLWLPVSSGLWRNTDGTLSRSVRANARWPAPFPELLGGQGE